MTGVLKDVNTICSSGPDWVTATGQDKKEGWLVLDWISPRLVEQEAKGEISQEWSGMGYKGFQIGPYRWGARNGSETILIISGDAATSEANQLPLPVERITRFDLQFTVKLNRPDPTIASRCYKDMLVQNKKRERPFHVKQIRSASGDTFYLNKRTSSVMIRVYDASHKYEPVELGRYWRVEVEYKRSAAKTAARLWNLALDRHTFTVNQCLAECRKRHLSVSVPHSTEISAIATKATVTTVESKLEWLSKTVSPVVAQLSTIGYNEAVIEALGLSQMWRTAPKGDKWL